MLVELICYLMLVETVICLILRLKIRITTHPPHQFHRVAELLGVHGEIHKPLSPQTITLQVPDGKKAKYYVVVGFMGYYIDVTSNQNV